MYLSRVVLNPRSRAVRRDLADCHQMHRTVMSAFPESPGASPRSSLGVLYRIESGPRDGTPWLLVQSAVEPQWSQLPAGYVLSGNDGRQNLEVKAIAERYGQLQPGMRLRFRLFANPTRKVDTRSGPDGQRRHGRRVELRGEQACLDWLSGKAEHHGFELTSVQATPSVPNVLARPGLKMVGRRSDAAGGPHVTVATVLFEGELRINDVDAFRRALCGGIGPGKAYGCGLFSIGPARS
ncbi:MAG: type I-E CRISPR-associated protein Cas6/Cse3/CasE [Candidatus Rokuibacteriota bacterium]